jgi:hypothetical protein
VPGPKAGLSSELAVALALFAGSPSEAKKWRYPANLCQFYGDVAAIWSMLISSILYKRGRDFKSFLVVLRPCSQGLDTLVVVECSKVRQFERKEEMSLPRDYEDLFSRTPNLTIGRLYWRLRTSLCKVPNGEKPALG